MSERKKVQYGHDGKVDRFGLVPPKLPIQARPVAAKPDSKATKKTSNNGTGKSVSK